ncbi:MAG: helix-turn-helix domain-containing protein [Acidobacteriota bacterium]|jgi:excisionase family DNA binding protein
MNAVVHEQKLAYRVKEAAAALGVSQPFVYRLIAEGEIRVTRLGRRAVLIPRTEIERLLAAGAEES